MDWTRDRALAVGALALGVATAMLAVALGLGARPDAVGAAAAASATITSHTVTFGSTRVTVENRPDRLTCATVDRVRASAHSCVANVGATGIVYAAVNGGVGGAAGGGVQAVIVRLTRRGTVWATLRDGAFYADVPTDYGVRRIVKVLGDGSRHGFAVTPS